MVLLSLFVQVVVFTVFLLRPRLLLPRFVTRYQVLDSLSFGPSRSQDPGSSVKGMTLGSLPFTRSLNPSRISDLPGETDPDSLDPFLSCPSGSERCRRWRFLPTGKTGPIPHKGNPLGTCREGTHRSWVTRRHSSLGFPFDTRDRPHRWISSPL